MKRFGGLCDQITTFENLMSAFKKASRGKKMKEDVARFCLDAENEIILLREELISGSYQPSPFFEFKVFEPKERIICSSDFRDRVVHHAICNIIEPIFERRLIETTYACRAGKGVHLAVQKCQQFSRRHDYFLKCDIAKYFDSIDHGVLKKILRRIFKDQKLMALLDEIIDHAPPGAPAGQSLPIGNLTSQHFANLYMGELDHFVKESLRIPGYLRYMDDFILFHDSKSELSRALVKLESFLDVHLRLKLKARVTLLAPVSQGVPFLGFRIFKGTIRLKRENLVRTRRKMRRTERKFIKGKITEEKMIQSMNSWISHLSHGNAFSLMKKEVRRSLKMA